MRHAPLAATIVLVFAPQILAFLPIRSSFGAMDAMASQDGSLQHAYCQTKSSLTSTSQQKTWADGNDDKTKLKQSEVIAKRITVMVQGSGPGGSGVIVKSDGESYFVLTADHVVNMTSDQEDIIIKTPDGAQHKLKGTDAKRLGDSDLAILEFKSANSYQVAILGSVCSLTRGDRILVSGFPLARNANSRLDEQNVITHMSNIYLSDLTLPGTGGRDYFKSREGYLMIYTAFTSPGMSGGPILDSHGRLVGIHGRRSKYLSWDGYHNRRAYDSMGIPINVYKSLSLELPALKTSVTANLSPSNPSLRYQDMKGAEYRFLRDLNAEIAATGGDSELYLERSIVLDEIGDCQASILDLGNAISRESRHSQTAWMYEARALKRAECWVESNYPPRDIKARFWWELWIPAGDPHKEKQRLRVCDDYETAIALLKKEQEPDRSTLTTYYARYKHFCLGHIVKSKVQMDSMFPPPTPVFP